LRTLFEVVIFEDRGNQWTLSRAILSIMLISEEVIIWRSDCYYNSLD